MRLLLLSNSTQPGDLFLGWPESYIHSFLGPKPLKAAFIPYAAVTFSFNRYEDIVRERFCSWGYNVISVHRFSSPAEVVNSADAIIVGGGNTFQLLKLLQEFELIDLIKEKVNEGIPYIGWSAGANLASPTICTTNDMPIVEPSGFKAFNFLPFQINPHYSNVALPGHGGETRDERLAEFIAANPSRQVLGLPEGSLLKFDEDILTLKGSYHARLFTFQQSVEEIYIDTNLTYLLK